MNAMPKSVRILLVEDNPGDVRLTQEALRDNKVANVMDVAVDGVEALARLRCLGPFRGAPQPDLILLDLNLPRKSGLEVLAEIKADEALRRIPVVILTTSDAERDVVRSYDLHANCYISKPVDLQRFMEVIRSIEDYWVSIVQLPPRSES